MMKAIPTMYRGLQFRSRLEAKWAAFFDQCGWPWSYEPDDHDGYIPDFMLGESQTYAEVKPFTHGQEFLPDLHKRIWPACGDHRVVMLGTQPRWIFERKPYLGWLLDHYDRETLPTGLWDLDIGYTQGNGKLGLCSMDGAWVNVIWNVPESVTDHPNKWARVWAHVGTGICHDSSDAWDTLNRDLSRLWFHACSITQWQPNY